MTTPPHPDLFAGRFLGWEPLAAGSGGRLFRVVDRWTGRTCALKVCPRGGPEEASLLREFALLSWLRHPCLIDSLDLVWGSDVVGHVLEYVPAVEPATLWSEGGEAAVTAVVLQSARGLDALHRHGWVHGDVSPGNILVWREGDRWRAKVADLGLALTVEEAARAGVQGTADTMAPETARGRGFGTDADLFGLAATAVTWIDGRSPWSEYDAHTALREVARLDRPLTPRRSVDTGLRWLVERLGNPDPASRREAMASYTSDPAVWNAEVFQASIHGLQPHLDAWETWLNELPGGQPAALILAGRTGSGRRTAADGLARRLMTRGWAGFREPPLAMVRDWLASVSGDPDPVRLAQELVQRFSGQDVVLVWPEGLGELEGRLYQAFLAARSRGEGEKRTLAVHARGLSPSPEGEWLASNLRARTAEWSLGNLEALRTMARDLGFGDMELTEKTTPLAVHLAARRARLGLDADTGRDGTIEREITLFLESVSPQSREVLALLGVLEHGWPVSELTGLLDPAVDDDLSSEILGSPFVVVHYEGDTPMVEAADWVAKAALCKLAWKPNAASLAERIASRLVNGEVVTDLGLCRVMMEQGVLPERYALTSLEAALRDGAFEQVLAVRALGQEAGVEFSEVFERLFVRAASRIGNLVVEAELLESLRGRQPLEHILVQRLAKVYEGLGKWAYSIRTCEELEQSESASSEVRQWARLQRAEALWQSGSLQSSDAVYQEAESAPDSPLSVRLKLIVGRARRTAQGGEIERAQELLMAGREDLGSDITDGDPMFLITWGGVLQGQNTEKAVSLAKRAADAAMNANDWPAYVMAQTKAGTYTCDLGDQRAALSLVSDSISTALAMGSSRIAAMAGCTLCRILEEMGRCEEALKRGKSAVILGKTIDDSTLIRAGAIAYTIAAARFGLEAEWKEGLDTLANVSYKNVESVRRTTQGMSQMLRLQNTEALESLRSAIEFNLHRGSLDDVLLDRLFQADLLIRMDQIEEAREILDELSGLSASRSANRLHGAVLLLLEVVSARITSSVEEAVSRLLAGGNVFLVCFLSGSVLGFLRRRGIDPSPGLKTLVLGAFESSLDSFDTPAMKKRFLSSPRYSEALEHLI